MEVSSSLSSFLLIIFYSLVLPFSLFSFIHFALIFYLSLCIPITVDTKTHI
ncbi:hypothetical protein RhiirA4_265470 [Rhizophagus irregularis]|uniref:Uncharacterized protein n=1 Tax=Rhizophagus irregularis TaxID=588596 RepID=A0A2I1GV28_9GLOM|nr:hypothetical protein RhiirA4_265470 [Rhizophagus irregularis]